MTKNVLSYILVVQARNRESHSTIHLVKTSGRLTCFLVYLPAIYFSLVTDELVVIPLIFVPGL